MTDRIAELRAIAGIPDELPPPPTADEANAWLTEQAASVIDELTPRVFRHPISLDPKVTSWIEDFVANPDESPSLLLWGPTGTGKTHQAYVAFRAAVLGSYERGRRVTYRAVTHPDFATATRPAPNDAHVDALARYSTCGLLLMDDLGAEAKVTEWAETTLYRLVNARWESGLPTIWTSNKNRADLAASLGERIVSRLWSPARRLHLDGPDRRRAARSAS